MGSLGGAFHPPAPWLRQARRALAGLSAAGLVAVGLATESGCSSSSGRRDMNYGTDVGLGYVPPDAGPREAGGEAASSLSGEVAYEVVDEVASAVDAAGVDGAASDRDD